MPDPAAAKVQFDDSMFGHPRGLAILFMTELWERFSYYGMRGLLILFMTDTVRGLAFSDSLSGAIYGLYTFGVYALALPGGWIADRILGKRKAVLQGGVLIALGHYMLAVPQLWTFYTGLFLVALGTGLLKPNVSAIVGDLYPNKDAKRDAGFSIFYSGINVGAFLGPLICSYLGESDAWGWHWGFGAAGVGMTLALIFYAAGQSWLQGAGELTEESNTPEKLSQARKLLTLGLAAAAAIVVATLAAIQSGAITIVTVAQGTGIVVLGIVLVFFAYTIMFAARDSTERQRIGVCFFLFVGAALFWSGFEQAGSSMNLFAMDYTNRVMGSFEVPAGWLQSVNPLFIIIFAPVVGMTWVWLGKRNPSIPFKFATGLTLLGIGFLVLAWGATYVGDGATVGMRWLVVTYFFHTIGELCLSPVGLSSMTKLAPDRMVSQMMGTWFMGSAIGNLIAGLVVSFTSELPPAQTFMSVAIFSIAGGFLFLILTPWISRLTVGIK